MALGPTYLVPLVHNDGSHRRHLATSDLIWNQLFVGASESCAEANVQLSLSDSFYEHQRGTFLGVYVLSTSIGTYLGPLIAGYIANSNLDWRWIGWWAVIISGGMLVVVYFTLEETLFERSVYQTEEVIPHLYEDDECDSRLNEKKPETRMGEPKNPNDDGGLEQELAPVRPNTYFERIALITPASNLVGFGFKQYLTRLLHTLRVFSFPAVIFAGVQWGAQDAWLTFYLTVEDDNWSESPWNYGDSGVGLMNVPCLIGAVLGCFYGGYLSDKCMIWFAKRNGGIREAEHRLWFLYPLAVINPLGMLLFGIGTGQGWSWPGPYVGLGLVGFGWGCTGDLSMAYLMDAYPDMVLEGMVGVSVINNSIACILTFTAGMWLNNQGVQNTFIVIAALGFLFVMTTLPMMLWGKRCRRWTKGRYLEFVRIRDSL